MAIAYQSYNQTTEATSSSTIVVTKPTGLSSGNLMVAQVSFVQPVGGGINVTAEADWVTVERKSTPTESNGLTCYIFYKIADTDDASASNFTFTFSNTISARRTASVMRFSGQKATTPITIDVSASSGGSGATITVGTSTPPSANCYALFFTTTAGNALTVSNQAFATDNPSWTELYDTGTTTLNVAFAYALRNASSATGNATATISDGAGYDWVGNVAFINTEPTTSTISETVSLTETIPQTIKSFFLDTLTLTETLIKKVGRLWTKLTKPITTWTNRQK